ncbi:MAG TPA: hypothetical protein VD764_04390 [Nocardioides sp.]|nr:hypothetical protein [Nocardioides sp.]
MVLAALVVLGLTLAFVVPAVRVTRTDRLTAGSASRATTCTPPPRTDDSQRTPSGRPADVRTGGIA